MMKDKILKYLNILEPVTLILVFVIYFLSINYFIVPEISNYNFYKYPTYLAIIVFGIDFLLNIKHIKKNMWVLLAFLFVMLLSKFLNTFSIGALSNAFIVNSIAYYICFYYYASKTGGKKVGEFFIYSCAVVLTIFSITSVYLYYSGDVISLPNGYNIFQPIGDNRISNVFFSCTFAGIYSLVDFNCLSYIYTKAKNKFAKVFIIILLLLEFFIILIAESRNVKLAFAVEFVILTFLKTKDKIKNKKLFILLALLGALVYILERGFTKLLNYTYRDSHDISKIAEMIQQNDSVGNILETSSNGRFNFWVRAISLVKGWQILIGRGADSLYDAGFKHTSTHNLIIDIYYTSGIIGLLIFGYFLILQLINFIKNIDKISKDKFLLFSLLFSISILCFSMFDGAILYLFRIYNFMFWYFLGALNFENNKTYE